MLIDGLNRIPGVYSPIPMGAFYTVAKLPVDDSDKFCAWCLSDFEYEGQTVFMATGFRVSILLRAPASTKCVSPTY